LGIGSPVHVGRLEDVKSIRAEVARLYRAARRRAGRYPDALTAQDLAELKRYLDRVYALGKRA